MIICYVRNKYNSVCVVTGACRSNITVTKRKRKKCENVYFAFDGFVDFVRKRRQSEREPRDIPRGQRVPPRHGQTLSGIARFERVAGHVRRRPDSGKNARGARRPTNTTGSGRNSAVTRPPRAVFSGPGPEKPAPGVTTVAVRAVKPHPATHSRRAEIVSPFT